MSSTKSTIGIVFILAAIAAFAILMGLRDQIESIWLRAAIAGFAGILLGLVLLLSRKRMMP
jgi:uncharacterized membrane protein HdeD (DUF308 family)